MIKALLLIFEPATVWDRIVAAQRRWISILLTYVLPFLVLVSVVEGYGLVHWGKPRGIIREVKTFPLRETVVFETFQILTSLVALFVGARLIKALGETFHGRHTFTQTFTVAAYGLGPVFLVRLLDVIPSLSPWATWGIGIALTAAILYHGVPRVMLPDPPHAFGLYLTSTLLLAIVTGLTRFITASYLAGKLTKLDTFVSKIAAHLPF